MIAAEVVGLKPDESYNPKVFRYFVAYTLHIRKFLRSLFRSLVLMVHTKYILSQIYPITTQIAWYSRPVAERGGGASDRCENPLADREAERKSHATYFPRITDKMMT